MNKDSYEEVINGKETYTSIAEFLKANKSVIIGWTDEEYTHYDILFNYGNVVKEGNMQRGIKNTDLFVSIIDKTSYGFKADSEKLGGYIAEKLRLGNNVTATKVTELINGVIKELNK